MKPYSFQQSSNKLESRFSSFLPTVSLLVCLNFTQAEPDRVGKDSSTVGRPSSGSKKPSHCSNGVPVIPNNDLTGVIPNGHINDLGVKNHVNGHHNHITEDALPPAENGLGEGGGRETVNSRGRSRERHSPRVQRGEEIVTFIYNFGHFNIHKWMFLNCFTVSVAFQEKQRSKNDT